MLTHTDEHHWNFSQDSPHPSLSRREYGISWQNIWSHMFTQSEGLVCLCVEDTSFLHYLYVTHITFFFVIFKPQKISLWEERAVIFMKTLRGKCEGLYSLVTYDSHQKHITKQSNCTGIKKQMCVCLQHACPCMSVHGCTDTTRGQHLAVKSNKTKDVSKEMYCARFP